MAERSLPDVKQHQYVVSPQCIRADYCSAVKIEGYARDDDAGESQSPVTPNPQSLIPSYSSLVHHRGILVFIRDLNAKDLRIFLIDDDLIDFRILDRSFFRLDLSIQDLGRHVAGLDA